VVRYTLRMNRGNFLLIVLVIVGLLLYFVLLGVFNKSRSFSVKTIVVPKAEDIYK
jgi:hypothetical protein